MVTLNNSSQNSSDDEPKRIRIIYLAERNCMDKNKQEKSPHKKPICSTLINQLKKLADTVELDLKLNSRI